MKVKTVDLRLIQNMSGNLRAFTDVQFTISEFSDEWIIVKGFSVMKDGKTYSVNPPRKVGRDGRWLDVVLFSQNVMDEIRGEVMRAFAAEQIAASEQK